MATAVDFRRAYRQLGRYLDTLAQEAGRSRSPEGTKALEKALTAFARADPDVATSAAALSLDHALSYGHNALNALLRQYRMPTHDPERFSGFYDVVSLPFRDMI